MTDPTPSTPAPSAPAPRGAPPSRRRWRRLRWAIRLAIGLPLILVLLVIILVRSPVAKWAAIRLVDSMTGARLECSSCVLHLDGRVVLTDASLHVPGLPAAAGELISARRAEIELDWSGILHGAVHPIAVRLDHPVFRVSVTEDGRSANFDKLVMPTSTSGQAPISPPLVDIRSGVIEIGEHTNSFYTRLADIGVSGSLTPLDTQRPIFTIKLEEETPAERLVRNPGSATGAPAGRAPGEMMILEGRADLGAPEAELSIINVDLERWPPSAMPSSFRALWARLDVHGRVSRATISHDSISGLSLRVKLEDVSLNALIASDRSGPGAEKTLALSRVRGEAGLSRAGLDADVQGMIQDLPCQVSLSTDGIEIDSALRCEIISEGFTLEKNPRLLPFAPEIVRTRLRQFSGPSALIDARVLVTRPAPVNGAAAPFDVSGSIAFRNGAAAFANFPYPFADMNGLFLFNDQRLEIVSIDGRGPTGATLHATGVIAPPDENAAFTIDVVVLNAPTDETLQNAMPAAKKPILPSLFGTDAWCQLIERGLVRPGAGPGEKQGAAPRFEPGGLADIGVQVRSAYGADSPVDYLVEVRFPEVRIIPAGFPHPVIGRDVLIELNDSRADLLNGEFTGLGGGTAHIGLALRFTDDSEDFKAVLTVDGCDIPADERLRHAISTVAPARAGDLNSLSIDGFLSGHAVIDFGAPGPIPYSADIEIARGFVGTRSLPDAPGLAIMNLDASVHLGSGALRIDSFSAAVVHAADGEWSPSGSVALMCGPEGPAPCVLHAQIDLFDLRTPVHQLIRPFDSDIAGTVSRLSTTYRPEGFVTGEITWPIDSGPDLTAHPSIRITPATDLSLDALDGRLTLGGPSGSVRVDLGAAAEVIFEDVGADLSHNAQPLGAGTAAGTLPLERDDPRHALEVGVTGVPIEHPVVRALLNTSLGDSGFDVSELDPVGVADVQARLARSGGKVATSLVVSPRSLAFSRRGIRVQVPSFDGRILIDEGGDGRFDSLVARGADWDAAFNGVWKRSAEAGTFLALDLSANVAGDSGALSAFLPQSVTEIKDRLELHTPEASTLSNAHLECLWPSAGEPAITFTGDLAFTGASLDAGLELNDLSGVMAIDVSSPSAGADAFSLTFRETGLRVLGIEVTGASGVITSAPGPDFLALPATPLYVGSDQDGDVFADFAGACHGGRIAVAARVNSPSSTEGAPPAPSAYAAKITVAGTRFAEVINDLAPPEAGTPVVAATGTPDDSRGRLDGVLSLVGVAGDPASRRGRGALRVGGGSVIDLPLILPLVQVSNLQLPFGSPLDFAEGTFAWEGPGITFEQMAVLSDQVALVGNGTLMIPDLALDMQFNSIAANRMPVFSSLFEGLRNELISTRIGGTLRDPKFTSEVFSGTRKLIGAVFDGPRPGIDFDPVAVEHAARSERARTRNAIAAPRTPALAPTTRRDDAPYALPSLPSRESAPHD